MSGRREHSRSNSPVTCHNGLSLIPMNEGDYKNIIKQVDELRQVYAETEAPDLEGLVF